MVISFFLARIHTFPHYNLLNIWPALPITRHKLSYRDCHLPMDLSPITTSTIQPARPRVRASARSPDGEVAALSQQKSSTQNRVTSALRVNESSPPEATQRLSAQAEAELLDPAEVRQLQQLKARDREVRAHEAAHAATAGQYTQGGVSYSYQRGPDGRLYAIGGEVGIDISPVTGNPQATLHKAEQVRAAALAPANPSSQDRSIAARASQLAAEARIEIARQASEEKSSDTDGTQQATTQLYATTASSDDTEPTKQVDVLI